MKNWRGLSVRAGIAMTLIWVLAGGVAKGDDERPTRLRWDIVNVTVLSPTPTTRTLIFDEGGTATATARSFPGGADRSKIVLTGSGFLTTESEEQPRDSEVRSGGGTWKTLDPTGNTTGQGTYQVVSLASFVPVPGEFPSSFVTPTGITVTRVDNIAPIENARGGFAIFRIEYSDGDRGFLTVSCRVDTSPLAVVEVVTATKENVYYMFKPDAALLYHVVPREE